MIARKLSAHGMAGFDHAAAGDPLRVRDDFGVEIMIAIGRPGNPRQLPEALRETKHPSGRRPLKETAFSGAFPQQD